ncbi:MAG: hypothetical protein ACKO85_14305, partial [Isosphaeraceae bacterium]
RHSEPFLTIEVEILPLKLCSKATCQIRWTVNGMIQTVRYRMIPYHSRKKHDLFRQLWIPAESSGI